MNGENQVDFHVRPFSKLSATIESWLDFFWGGFVKTLQYEKSRGFIRYTVFALVYAYRRTDRLNDSNRSCAKM